MGRLAERVVQRAGLASVRARRLKGEPAGMGAAELLRADLLALGVVADSIRRARHGDVTRIGPEGGDGPEVLVRADDPPAGRIESLRDRMAPPQTVTLRPDPERPATGDEILRAACACRILLDASHVALLWEEVGLELAQVALSFGVDELVGPILDESPAQPGVSSVRGIPRADLEDLVRKAGRETA